MENTTTSATQVGASEPSLKVQEPAKVRRVSSYALIVDSDEVTLHVLLSKLNHGPARGKWNLVGGGIQHGEDPLTAVVREIKEESGIVVAADEPRLLTVLSEHVVHRADHRHDLRYHPEASRDQLEDFHLIGIIYLVKLKTRTVCKHDGDGDSSDGCRWFSVDEVMGDTEGRFVTFAAQALKAQAAASLS